MKLEIHLHITIFLYKIKGNNFLCMQIYFFLCRPCVIRSGTREVHNKLEKNRRAHLKECFEILKKQLPSQDEKKSSNLSILHAANKFIQV